MIAPAASVSQPLNPMMPDETPRWSMRPAAAVCALAAAAALAGCNGGRPVASLERASVVLTPSTVGVPDETIVANVSE